MPATDLRPLTARQTAVLRFITGFLVEHWRQPGLREIARGLGLSGHPNSMKSAIVALRKKGWLVDWRDGCSGFGRVPGCKLVIEGVEELLELKETRNDEQ